MGTLYAQVERLVQQAGRQADAAVSLYYFNAALYLLRVLKGNAAGKPVCKAPKKEKAGSQPKGPEVSGPRPGSHSPRRTQAAGRGRLPVSQMGSGGHDSRGPSSQPSEGGPGSAPYRGPSALRHTGSLSGGPGCRRLGFEPRDPDLFISADLLPDQAQQSAHRHYVPQSLFPAPGEYRGRPAPGAPAQPRPHLTGLSLPP